MYYVMVYGSDDLYTSSFLGCFNRLLVRMKPKTGNEFLDGIGKDKFRTHIFCCASKGYHWEDHPSVSAKGSLLGGCLTRRVGSVL